MASLKDALASLLPIDFSALPSDLEVLMRQTFRHGELIMNSIPPPSSATASPPSISATTPNNAHKAADTLATPCTTPIDARNTEMHSAWGKPVVKINAKDNPLGVAVYKMSGHDKGGAWFSRRSIHQGLGFEKWKRAWQAEFSESLKVKGGPGAGAVRGITADRMVKAQHFEGIGDLEVWQLSAVFPGPVTPREFVELLMTSDNALSEASALDGTSGKPPRHFMVVSRPTKHDDAPPRTDLVRGTYESVEMIRELPVEGQENPELNPVEWMMVTRSDPGGGIPRFMVERGTPASVVADTGKFLEWACPRDDFAEEDTGLAKQKTIDEHNPTSWKEVEQRHRESIPGGQSTPQAEAQPSETTTASIEPEEANTSSGGILSSAVQYAEQTAAAYLPSFGHTADSPAAEHASEPTSPVSSGGSFMSADDGTSESHSQPQDSPSSSRLEQRDADANRARATSDLSSPTSSLAPRSLTAVLVEGARTPTNNHEKEILKLHKKMQQLDEKSAKERASDETKLAELAAKGADDKAKEHHAKHASKREEKAAREREKLVERQLKEEQKAVEKKRKEEAKSEVAVARRERDEAREGRLKAETEIAVLKREIDELRREVVEFRIKVAMEKGKENGKVNGEGVGVEGVA